MWLLSDLTEGNWMCLLIYPNKLKATECVNLIRLKETLCVCYLLRLKATESVYLIWLKATESVCYLIRLKATSSLLYDATEVNWRFLLSDLSEGNWMCLSHLTKGNGMSDSTKGNWMCLYDSTEGNWRCWLSDSPEGNWVCLLSYSDYIWFLASYTGEVTEKRRTI